MYVLALLFRHPLNAPLLYMPQRQSWSLSLSLSPSPSPSPSLSPSPSPSPSMDIRTGIPLPSFAEYHSHPLKGDQWPELSSSKGHANIYMYAYICSYVLYAYIIYTYNISSVYKYIYSIQNSPILLPLILDNAKSNGAHRFECFFCA